VQDTGRRREWFVDAKKRATVLNCVRVHRRRLDEPPRIVVNTQGSSLSWEDEKATVPASLPSKMIRDLEQAWTMIGLNLAAMDDGLVICTHRSSPYLQPSDNSTVAVPRRHTYFSADKPESDFEIIPFIGVPRFANAAPNGQTRHAPDRAELLRKHWTACSTTLGESDCRPPLDVQTPRPPDRKPVRWRSRSPRLRSLQGKTPWKTNRAKDFLLTSSDRTDIGEQVRGEIIAALRASRDLGARPS